ncbi:MAG: hypothetical protein ACLFUJ_14095 [Phycisphaerae bacterium]
MVFRTLGFATGTRDRRAVCEKCGCEFRYTIRRFGMASGIAGLSRASGAAGRDVEQSLARADGMAACPECGHFQSSMVRKARWFWLKLTLVLVPVAGVLWYFMGVLAGTGKGEAVAVLRTIQTVVLIVGGISIAMSLLMLITGDPNRFGFLRPLYRRKAVVIHPGNGSGAAFPAVDPTNPWGVGPEPSDAMGGQNGKVLVNCDACGAGYRIPAAKRGAKVRCKCGEVFQT